MQPTKLVTLSMRELDRLKVIRSVVDGLLKSQRAAMRLSFTTCQVRQLAARLRKRSAPGLTSGQCAKRSNQQIDVGLPT
jgi:hypothetical protein